MRKRTGGLVYATDQGRMCPDCRNPVGQCQCGQEMAAAGDGIVRVRRETKGRRGKAVTVITGVPLAGQELKALARELKGRCGTGGTLREGGIEIQGDHRDLLVSLLEERGWVVRRAGG